VQLNPIGKIKEIRIVINIAIVGTQLVNLNLTVKRSREREKIGK
jgi:hypothetical protein